MKVEHEADQQLENENKTAYIFAVRIDNASKLKLVLNQWREISSLTRMKLTVSNSSHQNDSAKRDIQYMKNLMRVMLKWTCLSMIFWEDAVRIVVYIRNKIEISYQSLNENESARTSYEIWTEKKPSLSHMRTWECKIWVYASFNLNLKDSKKKQMNRDVEKVFVRYNKITTRQIYIYRSDMHQIVKIIDLTFMKDISDEKMNLKLIDVKYQSLSDRKSSERSKKRVQKRIFVEEVDKKSNDNDDVVERKNVDMKSVIFENDDVDTAHQSRSSNSRDLNFEITHRNETKKESFVNLRNQNSDFYLSFDSVRDKSTFDFVRDLNSTAQKRFKENDEDFDNSVNTKRLLNIVTREKIDADEKLRQKFDQVEQEAYSMIKNEFEKNLLIMIDEEKICDSDKSSHVVDNSISISEFYKKAVNHSVWDSRWWQTCHVELRQLIANETFRETKRSKNHNIMTDRWIFDVKYASNERVERFKTRLVAREFSQQFETDFFNIFASIMRANSLRILLTLMTIYDLETVQIDVINTFSLIKLKEKAYMYSVKDLSEFMKDFDNVMKIEQSLYDLKQAVYEWYQLCKAELIDMSFKSLQADFCIFKKRSILIEIYVNDVIIAVSFTRELNKFKKKFDKRFKIKKLENLKRILDMRITRDRADRVIYIDQEQYLLKMLKRFEAHHSNDQVTRILMSLETQLHSVKDDSEMTDRTDFQSRTDSVMFSMIYTRFDVFFVTDRVAQYMSKSIRQHSDCLFTIFRYIKRTVGLRLKLDEKEMNWKLVEYSNANHVEDKSDRKSIIETLFLLDDESVNWSFKKQRSVASSIAKTEYISLTSTVKQARWISQMLKDLSHLELISKNHHTVKIQDDNSAVKAIVEKKQIISKTKHIDIAYHFTREKVNMNNISIVQISTANMLIDKLIKSLNVIKFEEHRERIDMISFELE